MSSGASQPAEPAKKESVPEKKPAAGGNNKKVFNLTAQASQVNGTMVAEKANTTLSQANELQPIQDLSVHKHKSKEGHASRSRLAFEAKMKSSKASSNDYDDLNKMETELTHSIKKLDSVIPVEKIIKETEAQEAQEAKNKVIVVKRAPTTRDAPPEPSPEEIRAKQMQEIHKTAWETYQMEKYGNIMKSPQEEEQEKKAAAEAEKQRKANRSVSAIARDSGKKAKVIKQGDEEEQGSNSKLT